jgi:DNA (cytosine-5)-methyltransferase 1
MVKHTDVVASRFEKIIKECKQGGNMNGANREKFGLRKHRISLMAANAPAPTITTLPDDILHYVEGRILTVRECARIQSFPDWFHFKGKFTTGGKQRKNECPRYTQVGNAVPPLLARAIGVALSAVLNECSINAVTRPLRLAPVSQKV